MSPLPLGRGGSVNAAARSANSLIVPKCCFMSVASTTCRSYKEVWKLGHNV